MSLETIPDAEVVEYGPVSYEQLGHPIIGPSALSGDWRRLWHLTFNIAVMNWKLRFFGSALGYVWQLIRPLMLFLVLYIFFTKISKVGVGEGPSEDFGGAQLLASIVLYTFFQEATMGAIRTVVDNETMVRKIQFPRIVIPLSTVLLACFNLGLNLLVVTIFAVSSGVVPMLTWLELIPIVGALVILSTGLAMLLSAAFVYFRDLQPIWEVVSQVIFYASPIILPIIVIKDKLSPSLMKIYMMNPLATIFQQFRHAFITHDSPSSGSLLGSEAALVIPVGIILVIFVLGFWVFNRTAPKVAEDL